MLIDNKKLGLILALFIFIIFPLTLYLFVDVPNRTFLKDTISLITYLSFMLLLGQFFIARSNTIALKIYKMSVVIKVHKIIGYIVIPVFLLHPFMIILPKFYESGLTPTQAFLTIITTFTPSGVLLGISAWTLMLILGLTSIFQKKLAMKYQTWRMFHGLLAIFFILFASWHAIDLGRHIDIAISIFIIFLALGGSLLLVRTYFFKPNKGINHD